MRRDRRAAPGRMQAGATWGWLQCVAGGYGSRTGPGPVRVEPMREMHQAGGQRACQPPGQDATHGS